MAAHTAADCNVLALVDQSKAAADYYSDVHHAYVVAHVQKMIALNSKGDFVYSIASNPNAISLLVNMLAPSSASRSGVLELPRHSERVPPRFQKLMFFTLVMHNPSQQKLQRKGSLAHGDIGINIHKVLDVVPDESGVVIATTPLSIDMTEDDDVSTLPLVLTPGIFLFQSC